MRSLFLFLLLLILALPLAAQELPAATPAEATAADGLALKGDFYLPADVPDEGVPALLLMHMLSAKRGDYEPLIPALVEAGYAVLNVDLRGHGETGDRRDWDAATLDVQTWLDWLREQPGVQPERIAIIGASIGSNLALIGCANDADCVTAIALSPGLDYMGVQPAEAVQEGLRRRSALLIASSVDRESATGVRAMFSESNGTIAAHIYPGFAHGTELFRDSLDSVTTLILNWLYERFIEL
jgi:acetyl esterase/lipase